MTQFFEACYIRSYLDRRGAALPTKKKTLKPEDLYRLKFIHGAQLSPDGKRLVYSVSHTDPVKEEEFVTLWLLTLASGQARQLTSGLAQDMFPQWSPHGDAIAFLSTRSLKPQIFLISVDGGEARQLTDLEQGVSEGL